MPRIYIETYGCQMNVSDSELMFGVLVREGYVHTDDPAVADVMLVNTCAVRDHAEQRVLGRMGELKRHKRPGSVLGVVGCMAQRLGPRLLERVPQVDLVVGPDGYRGLPELIARARAGERTTEVVFKRWEHYEDIAPVRGGAASAFVTVQRGCDYRCTFCIVPMTRGPERSRKLEDVVREVTDLASGGTTEVTLLGQTVNSYDDGTHDFADLLRAVGGIAGCGGCASHRPIPRTSPSARWRPWRRRPPCASTCTSRCRVGRRASSSGCSDATIGTAISMWSPRCAAPSPAWPSRPISSSDSRARPKKISRRPCRSSSWWGSTTRTPSSTHRARARRRRGSRMPCPTRWRENASSAWSARCGPSRAAATSSWWAAHTKCWSRGAPSGGSCCRAAPAPTRWRSSRAPTPGSVGIATSASRARPGRPSRPWRSGGWGRSSPSWGDERDVRGGTAGVREAASPAAPVLRLRHVPRRH